MWLRWGSGLGRPGPHLIYSWGGVEVATFDELVARVATLEVQVKAARQELAALEGICHDAWERAYWALEVANGDASPITDADSERAERFRVKRLDKR